MTNILHVSIWWIIFCVLHSALLHPPIKQHIRQLMRINNQSYRLLYAFVSVISLFVCFFILLLADGRFIKQPDKITYVLGGLLMFGSLYLMRESFKNYSLTTFLGLHPDKEPELNISGLNRYVRHPLYLSTILFFIGMMVFWPSDVFFASGIILIAYTVIGAKLEERKLLQVFGKAYADYMAEVPPLFPKMF